MLKWLVMIVAVVACWVFADLDSSDKLYSHILPITGTLLGLVVFIKFTMAAEKGSRSKSADSTAGAGIFTSTGDSGGDGGGGGDC